MQAFGTKFTVGAGELLEQGGASEVSKTGFQGLALGEIFATMPFRSLENTSVAKNLP